MSEQCKIHEPLNNYQINEESEWIDTATIAVDDAVGIPIDNSAQYKRDMENKNLSARERKLAKSRWKWEKERFRAHTELHNMLLSRLLKLLGETDGEAQISDFTQLFKLLVQNQFNIYESDMNLTHPPRIRSITKYIKNIFKKQDLLYGWDKMGKFQKFPHVLSWSSIHFFMKDPFITAALGDRFGKMADIVKDLMENNELMFSLANRDITEHKAFKKLYGNHIDNIIGRTNEIDRLKFTKDDDVSIPEHLRDWDTLSKEQKEERIKGDYFRLVRKMMDGRVKQIKLVNIPPMYQKEGNKYVMVWSNSLGKEVRRKTPEFQKWKRENPDLFKYIVGKEGLNWQKQNQVLINIHSMVYKGMKYEYAYRQREDGKSDLILLSAIKSNNDGTIIKGARTKNIWASDEDISTYDIVKDGILKDDMFMEATDFEHHGKAPKFKGRTQKGYRNYVPLENVSLEVVQEEIEDEMNSKNLLSTLVREREFFVELHDKFKIMAESKKDKHTELYNNAISYITENFDFITNDKDLLFDGKGNRINPHLKTAEEYLDQVLERSGIDNNLWIDMEGNIRNGTAHMSNIDENYDFNQYEDIEFMTKLKQARDRIKNDINAFDKQISILRSDIKHGRVPKGLAYAEIEQIENTLVQMEIDLENLETLVDNWGMADTVSQNKIKASHRAVFAESREDLMDPMNRRLDDTIVYDYIRNGYQSDVNQDLKMKYLNTLPTLDTAHSNWLTNRLKVTMGHLNFETKFMGLDISHANVAKWENIIMAIPSHIRKFLWKRDRIRITDADVKRQIIGWNMWTTSNLLGTMSAATNQFQTISLKVEYGNKIFQDATEKGLTDVWDESTQSKVKLQDLVARNAGVLDFITQFNDFLAGGEGKIGNMDKYTSIFRIVKQIMINKKNASYTNISNTLFKEFSDSKWDDYFKELSEAGFSTSKPRMLRKVYADILALRFDDTMTKSQFENAKMALMRRAKQINGEIKLEQVNRMAAWKLKHNIFFNHYTFSGVEMEMRTKAAMVGALTALKLGLTETKDLTSIHLDKVALRFARTAVSNTMFGMSPSTLPLMFAGSGRTLFQYKTYTYNQMKAESKILGNVYRSVHKDDKTFIGNTFATAGSILKGMGQALPWFGREGIGYERNVDFESGNYNQDVRKFLSWLFWRGSVTTGLFITEIAPMWTGIPALSLVARRSAHVRGLESPTLAIALRVAALMSLGLTGSDDDDTRQERVMRSVRFFLLSPILNAGIEPFLSGKVPETKVVDPLEGATDDIINKILNDGNY